MFSLFFGAIVAWAMPQSCGDILYYGRVIEDVVRTGRTPYGMINTQTGIAEYEEGFGPTFAAALNALDPTKTWINFGALAAVAEREFLARRTPDPAPRVVSVSAYPEPEVNAYPDRHVLRFGKLIEEMDWSSEPKAQIGSDRFGPLSYSKHFDTALTLEGEALAVGAKLYVMMQRGRTIFRQAKNEISLNAVLDRTEGFKIVRPVTMVPDRAHLETFVLERTPGPVKVPAMRILELKMALPPYRVFQL